MTWDTLVDGLRAYGVRYLSGGAEAMEQAPGELPDPLWLLCSLARSLEPRLRQATVALFLIHPELAEAARRAAASLDGQSRRHLVEAYVAAVYLQRMWRTRLRRYLGEQPLLPPHWTQELGLPDPDERFGKVGLATLAARSGHGPRAPLGPYEKVARLLFGQLRAERAAAAA